MTKTFRNTGVLIWAARLSLVLLALLCVTIGFEAGGVGIIVGVAAGVALIGAMVLTLRTAYLIDGSNVGFRSGLTGKVKQWVKTEDIAITTANYHNRGGMRAASPTIVYWTRHGGSTGINALFARIMLSSTDKEAIEGASAGDQLRPFVVPVSMLGPDAKAAFEQFSKPWHF